MKDILTDFYSRQKILPNGCIIWTSTQAGKYGYFSLKKNEKIGAHVFAFILYNKKEPLGHVHHKCKNELCCNPEHLEEIASWEHMSMHHKKEFCQNGHELDVVGRTKSRECKVCYRIKMKEYMRQRNGYYIVRKK